MEPFTIHNAPASNVLGTIHAHRANHSTFVVGNANTVTKKTSPSTSSSRKARLMKPSASCPLSSVPA